MRAAVLLVTLMAMAGGQAQVAAGGQAQIAAGGRSYLVIIAGSGGDDAHRGAFHQWAVKMVDSAQERLGLPTTDIIYLAERPEMDPQRIAATSTKDNIERVLGELAGRVAPGDRILILLLGHGSARSGRSRFNIPGPDITAADFARLLDLFSGQRIGFVNTTSASGDFVQRLSGPNRAVITATRDGRQYNETIFPRFFVEAFASDAADMDKNERVSLLEAFNFAVREVQRFYDDDGRLRTETALLDDNADGEGSHEPDPSTADGALARRIFLSTAGPVVAAGTSQARTDTELQALYASKLTLEERIEELKGMKESMGPELYGRELEALLIKLALTDRAIRRKINGEQREGIIR